ncbi:alginate lyase [Cohaesibacter sp. CAU 1516]|uniref:alginate lyase family protein n=1 Tax=Cohaesibacter sp. CAU 1516 TaxID=2576038 RepID=UPI0010FDD861|nr:alginate lyase family protein [Cohaesibacter sp. CAU 1516]TLP47162.1 alginate lyase [Cohaesibacter sp. CAU 1516]
MIVSHSPFRVRKKARLLGLFTLLLCTSGSASLTRQIDVEAAPADPTPAQTFDQVSALSKSDQSPLLLPADLDADDISELPAAKQEAPDASEESDEADEQNSYDCPDFPEPVITLDFESPYKAESKSRSELDKENKAKAVAALKPSDDFVRLLSRASRTATKGDGNLAAVDCVLSGINRWAEAGAYSAIESMTAKITYPSRVGGIAIAYGQVKPLIQPDDQKRAETIETWLRSLAHDIIDYWNFDAPVLASQGNLRAWAALSVVQIGLLLDEPVFLEWGLESQRIILDTQDPDGSLPIEMRRGQFALHYQMHAVAPMVTASALLKDVGLSNSKPYEEKLFLAAKFSIKAVDDPSIVETKVNKVQTVKQGLLKQKKHTIAWLEPYLFLNPDFELEQRIAEIRPLSNSKLGGNLTKIFK